MIITIDGLAMKKKEDFYQNIKEELDALYDFLTEQPDILQMKFLHYNMMQSQLGRSFCQQLLKVLQDADILVVVQDDGYIFVCVRDAYVGDAVLQVGLPVVVVAQVDLFAEQLAKKRPDREPLLAEGFVVDE